MTLDDEAVRAALEVTDAYIERFNERDLEGHAATMVYPTVSILDGTLTVWEDEGAYLGYLTDLCASIEAGGWNESRWLTRTAVHATSDKVHLVISWTRHRPDGTMLGTYDGLHILVRQDGRWGIKCRSNYDTPRNEGAQA